jgi:hypothetical protein
MAYQEKQRLYTHDDSYFVESHGAARSEAREHQREMRQRALAVGLTRLTADEYQVDIMTHMEFMEVSLSYDLLRTL